MFKKVNFAGKNAVISGATGAIGSAICSRLAKDGVNLTIISSNHQRLKQLEDSLKKYNINITVIECDLSSIIEIERLIEKKTLNENIDILVNSAGIFPNKPMISMKPNDYLSVLNINLNSAYLLAYAVVPNMIKKQWGRIVNIGSSSCYSGFRNTSAYCISKHGLLGLSRSLHDELKEYGIRVYNVSPSSTQGPMGLSTKNQDYSTFLDPKEVADYVCFAISQDGNAMSEEIFIKRMFVR